MTKSKSGPLFHATIDIIGINPFVFLPAKTLKKIFKDAGRDKGPVPVKGTIDGHAFIQTLVRYSGAWRLYINAPMLKASSKKVGDRVSLKVMYDPTERKVPMHPALSIAFRKDKKAKAVFDKLIPSRQKEINRYLGFLKTEESLRRNVERTLKFLHGKTRFIGRDKP